MPSHHRPAGRQRRRTVRPPLVIAAVVAAATGAVLVVQNLAGTGGCSDAAAIRLPVAADPAIAPALREVADRWTETGHPEVDGRCVAVEVTGAAAADVASALATSVERVGEVGGFVDVGTPTPAATANPASVPVVWVPDSSYWLARLRTVSRTMFEPDPPPLASTPIVLGASPAGAQLVEGGAAVAPAALRAPLLGALAEEQPLPMVLAQPRRDTAGLVGVGWLQQALAPEEADLPNLVAAFRRLGDAPPDTARVLAGFGEEPILAPVSEQAVTAHNQTGPATQVTAVPVADAPSLDFPYAVLARAPQDLQAAAGQFRTVLAGSGEVFARHGFRPADAGTPVGAGTPADAAGRSGTGGGPAAGAPPPIGSPEQVAQTLRIWTSATRDARVLSVVNVNASMGQPMETAAGPAPRIDVFRATALAGIPLFTPGTDLGQWSYAVGLDGDRDWVEGVPIDTLTPEHRQAMEQAIGTVAPEATEPAALFETLLAAYRAMQEEYDPTRSNTLIMWTDGAPAKPGGLTLDETLDELERTADVTRPIRVILLGLGPDADMPQLAAIAAATGGGAFPLVDPDQIALVFLRALLT